MTPAETLILAAYFFVLIILAIYGLAPLPASCIFTCGTGTTSRSRPASWNRLPVVTIQLPIYNEMYVADRLIDVGVSPRLSARAAGDPGPRRLDRRDARDRGAGGAPARRRRASTSSTSTGPTGTGYKAGALEAGLRVARGEFVAIFDADFVPGTDFLQRTVPHFADPRVGMVQARWGHINQDYSLLTQIQAILLDGHFVLEHGAPAPVRALLQLQRHGRRLAARGDRRRRRLAARHAHRGSRPELPGAARGLALRVPRRRHRAGGSAGGDERLQGAAAPLGEGVDPDLPQAAAARSSGRTCR